MLHALEQFLATPIRDALAGLGEVATVLGPHAPSKPGAVVIHARELRIAPTGEPLSESTEPRVVMLHEWEADGKNLDFVLPAELAKDHELIELESPPGHTLAPGDDYYLEGATIRLYHELKRRQRVRARLAGVRARGWAERRPCTIALELAAWAPSLADADTWLERALAAVLATLVELPNLESGRTLELGVGLRFVSSRSSLASERASGPSSLVRALLRRRDPERELFGAIAELELGGELDVLVARGAPEPVGLIKVVTSELELRRDDAKASAPERIAEHPVSPSGARPIEQLDIELLRTLGSKTRGELQQLSTAPSSLRELAELDVEAMADEVARLKFDVRVFVCRARLALEFEFPASTARPDEPSLAALLALTKAELAVYFSLDERRASDLHGRLPALAILFTDSALAQLHASNWTAP